MNTKSNNPSNNNADAIDPILIRESISNEKFNLLLKSWANNNEYYDDQNVDFPEFFGGMYLNANKHLVIQVTSLNDEKRNYFSKIIDLQNVQFEEVNYSIYELKETHKSLTSLLDTNSNDNLISCFTASGLSFKKNSANLYLNTNDDFGAFSTRVKEFLTSKVNIPFNKVNIIISNEKESMLSCKPGTEFPAKRGTTNIASRSTGFWAKDNTGALGIITTPHKTIKAGDTFYIGSSVFGTAETPICSGTIDGVFIKRTNSAITPSRTLTGWGYSYEAGTFIGLGEGATAYGTGFSSYEADRVYSMKGSVQDTFYTSSAGITNTLKISFGSLNGDSGGVVVGLHGSEPKYYLVGIIHTGTSSYISCIKTVQLTMNLDKNVY